ncbi:MAG: wax ester/triacylglycerol synthase domain-containing protein [Frankiaceae bacterium]
MCALPPAGMPAGLAGASRPYWIDDPDFDLDFHVRELALPPPGDDRQPAEQVARITARPFDRARPLWELYVISGLAENRVALLANFHHAAIDGVGGRELMTILLDSALEPAEPEPTARWRPVPSAAGLLARGLADLMTAPVRLMRMQSQMISRHPGRSRAWVKADAPAVVEAMRAPIRIASGDRELLSGAKLVAPRTPFNRTITPHRRWSFAIVSLDEAKSITRTIGGTINDFVMAACAGALRRWLIAHNALPSFPCLRWFHLDAQRRGGRLREPRLRGGRSHRHLINPPFNHVISNVPGPRTPLFLGDAQMTAYYPASAIADGLGLNVTVQSYLNNLEFGLLACRELVPDL